MNSETVHPHSIGREVGPGKGWRSFTKTVTEAQLMSWPALSEGLPSRTCGFRIYSPGCRVFLQLLKHEK